MIPSAVIFVGDDQASEVSLEAALQAAGFPLKCFASDDDFRAALPSLAPACVVCSFRDQERALALAEAIESLDVNAPIIILADQREPNVLIRAFKLGMIDVLERPVRQDVLVSAIRRAERALKNAPADAELKRNAAACLSQLTDVERKVLARVVAGKTKKAIAIELNIGMAVVEESCSRVMGKMGATSLAELIRFAVAGGFKLSILGAALIPLSAHLGAL